MLDSQAMISFRRAAHAGVVAILLAVGPATGALAQVQDQAPQIPVPQNIVPQAPAPPVAGASATLSVLNRPIIVFRGPLLGIPAAERAAIAEERITVQLDLGGAGAVTTATLGDNVIVQLDGRLAFAIAPVDAGSLLGESQAEVAMAAVAVLEQVVRESQEFRDSRARWSALGLAAVYLVGWLVVFSLLSRLRPLVAQRVGAFAEARAAQVKMGGTEVFSRSRARRIALRTLSGLYGIVVFLAAFETLGLILRGFPYTRPWGEQMNGFLVQLLQGLLQNIASAVPGLVVVAAIILIARLVLGGGRVLFERVRERRVHVHWLDPDLVPPTERLFTVVVWLFALVMAYPYLPGSGSAAFGGLSVLVGLMVSLGGASAIGQAISGLVLVYSRTFRVGDYVRIDDLEGTVVSMSSVQTRLRTGMGDEVIVANSRVVGATVRNYSRPSAGGGIVVGATVTIGYDAPWRQVHELLLQAARATDAIAATPAPTVFQTALSDFYVEYRLVCQTATEGPAPRARVMSDLHANIQDAFNAAGVQIMSPHYLGDPAQAKIVPPDQWDPTRKQS